MRKKRLKIVILSAIILFCIIMSINYLKHLNKKEKLTVSSNGLKIKFQDTKYIELNSNVNIKESKEPFYYYYGGKNYKFNIPKIDIYCENCIRDFRIELPSSSNNNDSKNLSWKYSVYLTDIKMTENYKSSEVKWDIDCGGSSFNGNFDNVTVINESLTKNYKFLNIKDIYIVEGKDLNLVTGDSCRFRLWHKNVGGVDDKLTAKISVRGFSNEKIRQIKVDLEE